MTRRFFLTSLLTAALAVSGLLAGCGGGGTAGGSAETIKIGSLESMTGDNATFGKSTQEGIVLAMEERNKAGGLLGKQIEVIVADDQSVTGQVRQSVLKLIEQDKVCAILGEVASGRTAAAAPDCQKNKIPLISPSSTRNDVTDAGDYIFRTCFTDALQGKWMVEIATDKLKAKKAAILEDVQNAYSVGLSKVIREEFTKRGGTIVGDEKYSAQSMDFQTQLTNIRGSQPDVVFLPGYYSEVVNMLPQARKLGITVPFIGGDAWDAEETIAIGKDAVNNCYFTNHYAHDDPDPKVVEFVAKYKARFDGKMPDGQACTGYDAACILFDAITRAGSADSTKIRDALAQTKDFPAVTGKITIDDHRNANKPGVAIKIEDGKMVMIGRVGEATK